MKENPFNKVYPMFSTLINGNLVEIWQRKETHLLGKINGAIDNWWAKVPRGPDDYEWVPWLSSVVNRPCWGVQIKTGNDTIFKHDNTRITKTGRLDITCNGRIVYSQCAVNIRFALARASSIIYELEEHPFDFANPDSEIGRKIWYKRQPAKIDSLSLDQGSINVRYDGEANPNGFNMIEPWNDVTMEGLSDWHGQEVVRDDILSHDIWWHRE